MDIKVNDADLNILDDLKKIFNKHCGFHPGDNDNDDWKSFIKANNAICMPSENDGCCSGDDLAKDIADLLEAHGEAWGNFSKHFRY